MAACSRRPPACMRRGQEETRTYARASRAQCSERSYTHARSARSVALLRGRMPVTWLRRVDVVGRAGLDAVRAREALVALTDRRDERRTGEAVGAVAEALVARHALMSAQRHEQ